MRNVVLVLFIFFISSCASYSPMNEKEWLNDHIDTGEFNKETLTKYKAVFVGNGKNKYSNISEQELDNISLEFLDMLQTKYGKDSIFYLDNDNNDSALYEIKYEILNNKVSQRNNMSGRTECFISERNMSVKLSVQNVDTGVNVWAGTIEKNLESSNCTERSEIKSESFGGILVEAFVSSIVEGAMDSITGTYDKPPSAFKVASRVILGFYKTMP